MRQVISEKHRNTYNGVQLPPDGIHLHTPPEEYDHNFAFTPATLRSDRVELRPFVPCLHAQLFADQHNTTDESYTWVTWPHVLPNTAEKASVFHEVYFRSAPSNLLHAVFSAPLKGGLADVSVPPDQWAHAGFIGFADSTLEHRRSELTWVLMRPEFQRTHVVTHAAGLLLHRLLDTPSQGGLNLRRVQWKTSTLNVPSRRAAERLGFKLDGTLRDHMVCDLGVPAARAGRPGDDMAEHMGRDTVHYSIIWEEWEAGGREHIDRLMAR